MDTAGCKAEYVVVHFFKITYATKYILNHADIYLLTFQECFSLILPQNSVCQFYYVLYISKCYDLILVVLKNRREKRKVKYQTVINDYLWVVGL